MECSICLDDMKSSDIIFTLSCNHKLHYSCFLSYAFKTKGHIFVTCPICREMNLSNTKFSTDPELNIRILCSHEKSKRCCHKTKKGLRCKNKAVLLNYGYCSIHNKEILPKNKYLIMSIYLYYIIQTNNTWYTKIFLIDLVKKLLIKYPEIEGLEQIHYYMLCFKFHRFEDDYIISSPSMYEYYNLETPPEQWTNKCISNRILI